ncbi:MAG: DUF1552 domain-containing protein [Planctomycetaceae bacterium]|nr:DUF1552 domain-containing protein [Planctomycetaceae bacterium]
MPFSRRHFLKTSTATAGALAISPSFNHLLAEPNRLAAQPHRFVLIRKSNGNLPAMFSLPSFSDQEKKQHQEKVAFEADLDRHELPTWLRALDGHKANLTMLHGLSMKMSGGGHYSFTGCLGAYKAGRNVVNRIKRATIDFELARLFPSPFGHVELSLASGSGTVAFRSGIVPGFSAPAPKQRNYCYADPQAAYDELFKSVTNTDAVASENDLLDYLRNEEGGRLSGLAGSERLKVSNHVDSIQAIRERNNRVAALSDIIEKNLPTLGKVHANGGPDATLLQKQEAFTEVLLSALITGLTNVVTYTIDDLGTPISTLPGNKSKTSIHQVGHQSPSGFHQVRELLLASHMRQIARIVEKLKSVPEGDGTMFDNTTIIYMPETGDTHHGWGTEAPMVILTGANSKLDLAGRYLRLPYHASVGHQTLGNWYTTLLNAYGNPIEHYGDLDPELERKQMNQTGSIRQFLA